MLWPRNAMQYTPWVREIRWTEWSEDHIAKHGVTPTEVEEVIYRSRYLRQSGKGTEILVRGRTAAGRLLLIVFAPDPEPGGTWL